MSEQQCTCHCGGSMFYRHLHAESCALSRDGEEAPVSVEQALRTENVRLKEALEIAQELLCVPERNQDAGWEERRRQVDAALQPERGRND